MLLDKPPDLSQRSAELPYVFLVFSPSPFSLSPPSDSLRSTCLPRLRFLGLTVDRLRKLTVFLPGPLPPPPISLQNPAGLYPWRGDHQIDLALASPRFFRATLDPKQDRPLWPAPRVSRFQPPINDNWRRHRKHADNRLDPFHPIRISTS
jgi:hypothetical protein